MSVRSPSRNAIPGEADARLPVHMFFIHISLNTFRFSFVLGVYKQLLSFEYKFGSVVPAVTLLRAVHIYRSIKMVLCYIT